MMNITKNFWLFVLNILFILGIGFSGFSQSVLEEQKMDSSKSRKTYIQPQPITESAVNHSYAIGKEEAAEIFWSLDHTVAFRMDSVIIKCGTKLESKKKDKSSQKWKQKTVSATSYKAKMKGLKGGENYIYKIGFSKTGKIADTYNNKDNLVWSEKGKFATERSWGIFKLLVLIGALGFFIFGMKVMSEGLQKAAGSQMRRILSSMTSNRYVGVLSGFLLTGLVQSSSATTVMTVSFVNAGLLTLLESAGIMMGANIGTTITGWLIDLVGFKVSISTYSLVIIAFAAPMLFFKSSRAKSWGQALIGFAILFMGLHALKLSVPSLAADSAIVQFFVEYKEIPFLGNLMFIMLGTLVTVVIQSSSAAMALTMTLCSNGVIPFEVAAAMILGENIGTTITAELASIIGNVHAKRSARIHSLFNIVGVTWMFFLITPCLQLITYVLDGDPFTDTTVATTGLAAFHTFFNFMNVLLLIWFVPQLVNIAIRTVKSKGEMDEQFQLEYISAGMMGSAELSIIEAKKETAKFGQITARMLGFVKELFMEKEEKKSIKIMARIKKYEEITDRMEVEIGDYLLKISESGISESASVQIRSLLSMSGDLERVGDICYQMAKSIERKIEKKTWFTPIQRENILEMFDLLEKAFLEMEKNLNMDYDGVSIDRAKEIEDRINIKRDAIRKQHLKSIEQGDYNIHSGLIYTDLFSSCEKVGDQIINVSEAITGQIA